MINRTNKKFVHVSISLFLWLAAVTPYAFSQPQRFEFTRFAPVDEQIDNVITAIQRDTPGFLWIGTQRGLIRYDGNRFEIFADGEDGRSLPHYEITDIAEDPFRLGFVWIATARGGVVLYNPYIDNFARFSANNNEHRLVYTKTILPDSFGTVWLGTANGNIARQDFSNQSQANYTIAHSEKCPNQDEISISALLKPASLPNYLLIGTSCGLLAFDLKLSKFHVGEALAPFVSALKELRIVDMIESENSIWVATGSGTILKYSPFTKSFQSYSAKGVNTIVKMRQSRRNKNILLIGTRGQGLAAFNMFSERIEYFIHNSGDAKSISGNNVRSIFEDKDQTLWTGTGSGLNKSTYKRFSALQVNNPLRKSKSVATLFQPRLHNNQVWVSTLHEGIDIYDRQQDKSRIVDYPDGEDFNEVFAIHEDSHGNVWLGAVEPYVFRYQQTSKNWQSFKLGETGVRNMISQIYQSPADPHHFWICNESLGLLKFDPNNGKVVDRFTVSDGLISNNIYAIAERPHQPGVFWVLCYEEGINLVDTNTGIVKSFYAGEETSLPSNDHLAIAEFIPDTVWIGTYNTGLVRFDPANRNSTIYYENYGLTAADIGSIQQDNSGRLWLNSGGGLFLFDPATEVFSRFTTADGLQDNEFHYHASQINHKGELLVGGKKGFHIFKPEEIVPEIREHNTVITEIFVDGQEQPFGYAGIGKQTLEYSHLQNDIAFEFATLDLRNPEKNQYRVWLEGADTAWTPNGNASSIRYPALTPGEYRFRVTGSNSEGFWSTQEASVHFIITPPFWNTWWFWSLISLGVIGLIVSAYQYRISHLKKLERTRIRIADDLHDDIGSKMSSIAIRLDKIGNKFELGNEPESYIKEISDVASEVVDDLQNNIWIVDAGKEQLAELISQLRHIATSMLEGLPFDFQKRTTIPDLNLEMDVRRNVVLIFKELLNNVVKHADASNVHIRISFENKYLAIEVEDNGVGFDSSSEQRGRGLNTIQSRARELQGEVTLVTSPGAGTKQSINVKIV